MKMSRRAAQMAFLLAILSVPALLVAMLLSLNVAGFCFQEHRFLTDDEIIRLAAARSYALYPTSHYLANKQLTNPIVYTSLSDFMERNPNCCSIVEAAFVDDSESDFRVPLLYSLLGTNAAVVRVVYRVEAESVAGDSVKSMPRGMIREYWRITNCGGVGLLL